MDRSPPRLFRPPPFPLSLWVPIQNLSLNNIMSFPQCMPYQIPFPPLNLYRYLGFLGSSGSVGSYGKKSLVTPPGVDPETVRLVAHSYATPGPVSSSNHTYFCCLGHCLAVLCLQSAVIAPFCFKWKSLVAYTCIFPSLPLTFL